MRGAVLHLTGHLPWSLPTKCQSALQCCGIQTACTPDHTLCPGWEPGGFKILPRCHVSPGCLCVHSVCARHCVAPLSPVTPRTERRRGPDEDEAPALRRGKQPEGPADRAAVGCPPGKSRPQHMLPHCSDERGRLAPHCLHLPICSPQGPEFVRTLAEKRPNSGWVSITPKGSQPSHCLVTAHGPGASRQSTGAGGVAVRWEGLGTSASRVPWGRGDDDAPAGR